MECPKCGTVQPDGREQCGRCGIVFERWRAHQERAQLMQRRTQSSPPPPRRMQIPLPMVIVGAAFVLILGLLWTRHHYAAAEKNEKTDMLDQINQQALQARRSRLRIGQPGNTPATTTTAPSSHEYAGLPAATPQPLQYPDNLDESSARKIIEDCRFFHDPRTFDIPRKFPRESYAQVAARYPVLATAARQQLITLSPPPGTEVVSGAPDDITVSVTGAGYSQLDVHDSGGDTIQLSLGRRRLQALWVADTQPINEVTLGLSWTYERPDAAALAADSWQNHKGAAKLQRDRSGAWTLRFAWVDSDHGALYICP